MPEGHTLHRLARDLTSAFAGERLAASSPQGRFADSAALIDGRLCDGAEAYGKHLFIGFEGHQIVHVHLGLYGKLTLLPTPAAEPYGQVRLRLVGSQIYADLRGATTCELVTPAKVQAVIERLGPDPLRPGADGSRAWARIRRSPTSVAALLMNQEVLAGVGNVYRAELLYRHRIPPSLPGRDLAEEQWQAMWDDLVRLMHEGVEANRIDTVRPEHTPEAMGRPPRVDDHGGEVYVYRRTGQPCHVCGTPIATAELQGRNLFWCPVCQA